MPTGYTAKIAEGEGVTFPEFALACARAFGALILMRDDSPDAPIPDQFPADTYHRDRQDKALAHLIDLSNMTDEECAVEAKREYVDALSAHRRYERAEAETKARYEAMLDQVLAWEPPTDEHVELKAFMVEQIESSIRFDTGYERPSPVRKTGAEWRTAQREKAERDVEYHAKEQAKADERATGRSEWVQQLKASL